MNMLELISKVSNLVLEATDKVPTDQRQGVYEKLDDGLDMILGTLVGATYGVEVICNPDGDRGLISIDGVKMGHYEFAAWLTKKENEETEAPASEEKESQSGSKLRFEDSDRHYPGEIIDIISFDGELSERDARREVKFATGCFVASNSNHTLEYDEENNLTILHDVVLGRRASASELIR